MRRRRRASRPCLPTCYRGWPNWSRSKRRSLSLVAAEPLADLEVIRVGNGSPLLLLHGPTTLAADLPFIAALGRHAEIIAPAHPGFGGSARPDQFDSMYDLVRLYLDVLERLPYDEIVLVGLSFGAWLAAEIATVCSHKLSKLVLVDAVGIKLGDRTERDIAHLFNTPPAEL